MIKRICSILLCVLLVSVVVSCGKRVDPSEVELPDDFAFSVIWNFGMSSYDSATGKLIKASVIEDAGKYINYVKMSEEDLKAVYCHLYCDIDINDYPDSYDPFRFMTAPTQTFIISATANGVTKTVRCENIACSNLVEECYCREAKEFWTAKIEIVDLITSLPEWKALPDYSFNFD